SADRRREVPHEELEVGGAELGDVGDDALDLHARLINEDHADETEGDAQEDRRTVADLVELGGDGAVLGRAAKRVADGLPGQVQEAAHGGESAFEPRL